MTRGGPREAGPGKKMGRPAVGKKRSLRLSDSEYTAVKKFVKEMRRKDG